MCVSVSDEQREQTIAAIAARARAGRPRVSRRTWILSLVLGGVCLVGFLLLIAANPGEATSTPEASARRSDGFVRGLVVGGALGIAIGVAVARRYSGGASDHSSRRSP